MARVASEVVPHGRIGSGEAQVFGTPSNPLTVFRDEQRKNIAMKAAREKGMAEEKKKRDERIAKFLEKDPEKTFEPFNKELNNAYVNEVVTPALNDFASGLDPNSPEFVKRNKERNAKVQEIASTGTMVKSTISDTRERINNNELLDNSYYYGKINDAYLSDDGRNAKPHDKIDLNAIGQIDVTDPRGFKIDEYARMFVGDLQENVITFKVQRNKAMGLETDIEMLKSKLYTPDESTPTGVAEDPEGNPIINVTEEVVTSFLGDPYAKRLAELEAKEMGLSLKDYVESKVSPYAYKQKTLKSSRITKRDNTGPSPEEVKRATSRLTAINNIQNAFYDASGNRLENPTTDAQQALGRIKSGAKVSGMPVVDAIFVPGVDSTESDQNAQFLGEDGVTKPYDRVVVKVKGGSSQGRTQYTLEEIDLTDPGAGAQLNNVFQTSEGEDDLEWDELMSLNQQSGGSLYRNVYKNEHQAAQESAVAKEAVSEIQQGVGIDRLSGKVYNGKKIDNVKFTKTGWWNTKGNFLDVLFEDGTAAEIPADKYEDILSILEGGNTSGGSVKMANTGKGGKPLAGFNK